MRITRVYTKIGDEGQTQLVGGTMVSKSDGRIEAYGTVDELNALIGTARSTLVGTVSQKAQGIDQQLKEIQNDLFRLGAQLACDQTLRDADQINMVEADVVKLESWIDVINSGLPPLVEFVLPGGTPTGSALHVARTVCRRAERRVVTLLLPNGESKTLIPVTYLNRLSDFLFVVSRHANSIQSTIEPLWDKPTSK